MSKPKRDTLSAPTALDSWLAANDRIRPDETFFDISPRWTGWKLVGAWVGLWTAGVLLMTTIVWVIYQFVLVLDWLLRAPT